MSTFIALEVSYEVITLLTPIIAVVKTRSADLADQMERALASVSLNLAEGSKRVGRDRTHLFRIAAGSCAEVRAAIKVSQAFGHLGGLDLGPCEKVLDRQAGLLHGLTNRRS